MQTKIPGTPLRKGLVVLVLFTLLAAGSRNHESAAGQSEIKNGDKPMLAEKIDHQTKAIMPSIDAKAPAEFETATFGLG